ncbi:MAG: polysaccharide biosynthesis protein [Mangrovibacterium sp.]
MIIRNFFKLLPEKGMWRIIPQVRKDRIDGKLRSERGRAVNIEDLPERAPLWKNREGVAAGLKDAVVLVTGAAGTVGSGIVRRLMAFECKRVILLDQAEMPLSELHKELLAFSPRPGVKAVLGSVTDSCRMRHVFEECRPQYVFHAAANKHVSLMEAAPYEAILTNVGGASLLADLAVEFGVKKFMMVSTSDAVNPSNVVGISHRISEIYVQALARLPQMKTQFITTRFGNVLGSNGSVVPLFIKQIEAGGPVTVTSPDIARRFISVAETCRLILESVFMGRGGEIYLFDMGEPVKIYDLAVKMISLAGLKPEVDIPIRFTGLRPGERLHEESAAYTETSITTSHPRIRIAKTKEYNYDAVKHAVDELLKATQAEPAESLVQRMKTLVSEFTR